MIDCCAVALVLGRLRSPPCHSSSRPSSGELGHAPSILSSVPHATIARTPIKRATPVPRLRRRSLLSTRCEKPECSLTLDALLQQSSPEPSGGPLRQRHEPSLEQIQDVRKRFHWRARYPSLHLVAMRFGQPPQRAIRRCPP